MRGDVLGAPRLVFFGELPGLRWRCLRFLAALEAVVLVEIAGRPQGLVVETRAAGNLFELFRERVNCVQLRCRCGQFKLGRFKEFLVASVQQPRHFSTHHDAGMNRKGHRLLFSRDKNRGGSVFCHQNTACDRRVWRDIETVGAQRLKYLIKVGLRKLSGHGRRPVCEDK